MMHRIADFDLRIDCDDALTVHRLDSFWQTLFHWTDATTMDAVRQEAVSLHLVASPPSEPETALYDMPSSLLSSDSYHLNCGASRIVLDVRRSRGSGYLAPEFWELPLVQQRQFFMKVVILLLHGRGGYSVHANGIAWNEDGALIVGCSGSGKTTLTLGLIQAGARCLGDDALLLRAMGDHVRAYALRRGFACTAENATQFPLLADALVDAPVLRDHKKLLALETLWPACFTPHCTPRLILFPEITNAPHTRLTPLNPAQTLCAILEQDFALLLDATLAHQHLALLNQLVRQARGYRLHSGRDVYAEPARVAALLQDALQAG